MLPGGRRRRRCGGAPQWGDHTSLRAGRSGRVRPSPLEPREAVTGTGSFTLLDGSAIRTPGAGVFTASGENMENYGVPPDVLVDNTPADFLGGHDRQIEKAIETLRAQK